MDPRVVLKKGYGLGYDIKEQAISDEQKCCFKSIDRCSPQLAGFASTPLPAQRL